MEQIQSACGSGPHATHQEAREGFPEEGAVPLLLLPSECVGRIFKGAEHAKEGLLVGSRVPQGSGPCPLSAIRPTPVSLSSCCLTTQPAVESGLSGRYLCC